MIQVSARKTNAPPPVAVSSAKGSLSVIPFASLLDPLPSASSGQRAFGFAELGVLGLNGAQTGTNNPGPKEAVLPGPPRPPIPDEHSFSTGASVQLVAPEVSAISAPVGGEAVSGHFVDALAQKSEGTVASIELVPIPLQPPVEEPVNQEWPALSHTRASPGPTNFREIQRSDPTVNLILCGDDDALAVVARSSFDSDREAVARRLVQTLAKYGLVLSELQFNGISASNVLRSTGGNNGCRPR